MTVAFRDAEEADRHYIVDNWVASYRKAHAAGMIAMEDWYATMIPQVEKVLARPRVRTIVAFEVGVSRIADIYGFITADPELETRIPRVGSFKGFVYYVYVKDAYRRSGHARGLFAAVGIDPSSRFLYACKTVMVTTLMRKIPASRWEPLLAREKIDIHGNIIRRTT